MTWVCQRHLAFTVHYRAMAVKEYYRNKLALIIGGSEGIGRAIATGLVERGAHGEGCGAAHDATP
ncbi:MAG TPA: hypothetical protein ENI80_02345 [Acidiferrobacteraceae bacterium]|nr:hypothetical protein [Acidiferrobacteraceae bacterium]